MYPFGISIKSHIVTIDEILKNFLIGGDLPACIKEIKIWDSGVDGQNSQFELASRHAWDVLNFVGFSWEGYNFQLFLWIHWISEERTITYKYY